MNKDILLKAITELNDSIQQIEGEAWQSAVPSTPDWSVEELVEHLVENNQAVTKAASSTINSEIAEDDVDERWNQSVRDVRAALQGSFDGQRMVESPVGQLSLNGFCGLMVADRVIHHWDILNALDISKNLDEETVRVALENFKLHAGSLIEAGEVEAPDEFDEDELSNLEELLSRSGRR